MRITRIYTDGGQSRFEEIEVAFALDAGHGVRTPLLPAAALSLHESDEPFETDFHPAPRRQFVFNAAGVTEIECGNGARRRFGPGDVFFAEDTTGQGHVARALETPRRSIVVPVPDGFDLGALRAAAGGAGGERAAR